MKNETMNDVMKILLDASLMRKAKEMTAAPRPVDPEVLQAFRDRILPATN